MKLFTIILNLIITAKFIYGQENNDCVPVNILMGREESFDCCSDTENIVCENDHVVQMQVFTIY